MTDVGMRGRRDMRLRDGEAYVCADGLPSLVDVRMRARTHRCVWVCVAVCTRFSFLEAVVGDWSVLRPHLMN